MTALYPLKFKPIFKEKIWGGSKIKDVLKKDFGALANCGESWEISGVEGAVSVVAEGALKGMSLKDLLHQYGSLLAGTTVYEQFGDEFPLLIKFIDANDDLSVQVHPDDELAMKRHQSFGKTEMWYILQADPGSTLISGFNEALTRERYLEYFNAGKVMDVLNEESVSSGDVYFLPAGRVHTIGKGLLLAEIQQTSDVTYRIYDFDRRDSKGHTRELHTTEALDALDFSFHENVKTSYKTPQNSVEEVVDCPYFQTKIQHVSGSEILNHNPESFTILIAIEGAGTILHDDKSYPFKIGETMLIPASIHPVSIESANGLTFLTTKVPQ